MNEIDTAYMEIAIEEAKKALETGDVPIGAVIVLNDEIISQEHNRVEELSDATAHAEILAIKAAIRKIGYKHLLNCTMYVTLEPCSMCAGAIVLTRIKRLVYAASDPKAGACSSIFNIVQAPQLNHFVETTQGIMKDESSSMLTTFFKQLRNKDI
jgi:tRNA(adenine34) deaminase